MQLEGLRDALWRFGSGSRCAAGVSSHKPFSNGAEHYCVPLLNRQIQASSASNTCSPPTKWLQDVFDEYLQIRIKVAEQSIQEHFEKENTAKIEELKDKLAKATGSSSPSSLGADIKLPHYQNLYRSMSFEMF